MAHSGAAWIHKHVHAYAIVYVVWALNRHSNLDLNELIFGSM